MTRLAGLGVLLLLAEPVAARDSLGVFDGWAAFRDAAPKRCYAIARPQGSTAPAGTAASVAIWPERKVRGQVHLVLSRAVADEAPVRLRIGAQDFALIAKGRNAWGANARMDAAIIAAMRSASSMIVNARSSSSGGGFADRYTLAGAATAIDAAAVGCARPAS